MKALIIVDIQNDFLPGGVLAVPEGDAVIQVANRLMPHFDLVVATQDWHPKDHCSFAASYEGRQPGDIVELKGITQILWPTHCMQGTQGAEFAADLDVTQIMKVFPKGIDPAIDSYSGFFDNGHQQPTGLGDFLMEQGVDGVYVLGLATDYCVKFTALDARRLGLTTHLIEDGCRGVNITDGDIGRALAEMRKAGVIITRSNMII